MKKNSRVGISGRVLDHEIDKNGVMVIKKIDLQSVSILIDDKEVRGIKEMKINKRK